LAFHQSALIALSLAGNRNAALERPPVDRAVLDVVKGHVFDPDDFIIRTDGVCRLNPEIARMIVTKVST
jgi:hypothetical protein